MIFMAPNDADWDNIAEATGDASWRAENMRRYFERLEDCRYRPLRRLIAFATGGLVNPAGHGWKGWLTSERPLPARAIADLKLIGVIRDAIEADLAGGRAIGWARAKWLRRMAERLGRTLIGGDDPNDRRTQGRLSDGLCKVPLATSSGSRRGARERLLEAVRKYGLRVEYDALATRIVLDEDNRAVAIEYLKGRNLYRASPTPSPEAGAVRRADARREVIVAGGAFNTPQLLMLSGVGPKDHLAALGVDARVHLEGVGANLQDRYEIGVIHKAAQPWACLEGVEFAVGDPAYRAWLSGQGMYVSNGAAVAFSLRSGVARQDPDLFVMALVTRFSGYFPGYSEVIRASRDDITFSILKAHTNNRGGTVRLATTDPRDPPRIDFKYFEEGTDASGNDLTARRRRRAAGAGNDVGDGAAGRAPCGGHARRRRARRHGAQGLHPSPRLGPSRLMHLRDRPGKGRRSSRQRFPGARNPRIACCGRERIPSHPGILHCLRRLHDCGEGGGRHSRHSVERRARLGMRALSRSEQ
jgi:choline dehydrogenase-like flavoprotein